MTSERFGGQAARDRRRKRLNQLVDLARHLPEADRLLIEHIYWHGLPISRLAKATGCPPRTLQRRLAILIKHMSSTEFQFLARRGRNLDPDTRRTACRVILLGQNYRHVADELGLSLHEVRRQMARFRRHLYQRLPPPQWPPPPGGDH
ncbi:MAG: sigma-70 family RNA polymerase sigma factor [Phycisphaeraceae bacterium]|nr:sigma-70 family RNA polymerase sigma factor [Phycisphaeraceae bacterium]